MAVRKGTEARILDAAEELFFTRGIAATPVDAITQRAGVSPATLYRGYPSKEALLAAALQRRQRAWVEAWDDAVALQHDDEGRLLAVFDAMDSFRGKPLGARWCAFLGSAAEYASPPAEVAEAVRDDTETLRRRLTELALPVVGKQAATLADQLLLIVTGDLAMHLRDPGRPPATTATARSIATALLPSTKMAS